jgi:hypothetical protein
LHSCNPPADLVSDLVAAECCMLRWEQAPYQLSQAQCPYFDPPKSVCIAKWVQFLALPSLMISQSSRKMCSSQGDWICVTYCLIFCSGKVTACDLEQAMSGSLLGNQIASACNLRGREEADAVPTSPQANLSCKIFLRAIIYRDFEDLISLPNRFGDSALSPNWKLTLPSLSQICFDCFCSETCGFRCAILRWKDIQRI